MYKKMFEMRYDDVVSYGTAEDKIGEEVADKIFGAISPFFGTVVDGFESTLGNATDYTQHAFSGLGSGAEQYFGNAYDSTMDFFDAQLSSIGDSARDAIHGGLRDINFGERVNGFAHSSWNYINRELGGMLNGIKKGF